MQYTQVHYEDLKGDALDWAILYATNMARNLDPDTTQKLTVRQLREMTNRHYDLRCHTYDDGGVSIHEDNNFIITLMRNQNITTSVHKDIVGMYGPPGSRFWVAAYATDFIPVSGIGIWASAADPVLAILYCYIGSIVGEHIEVPTILIKV